MRALFIRWLVKFTYQEVCEDIIAELAKHNDTITARRIIRNKQMIARTHV